MPNLINARENLQNCIIYATLLKKLRYNKERNIFLNTSNEQARYFILGQCDFQTFARNTLAPTTLRLNPTTENFINALPSNTTPNTIASNIMQEYLRLLQDIYNDLSTISEIELYLRIYLQRENNDPIFSDVILQGFINEITSMLERQEQEEGEVIQNIIEEAQNASMESQDFQLSDSNKGTSPQHPQAYSAPIMEQCHSKERPPRAPSRLRTPNRQIDNIIQQEGERHNARPSIIQTLIDNKALILWILIVFLAGLYYHTTKDNKRKGT